MGCQDSKAIPEPRVNQDRRESLVSQSQESRVSQGIGAETDRVAGRVTRVCQACPDAQETPPWVDKGLLGTRVSEDLREILVWMDYLACLVEMDLKVKLLHILKSNHASSKVCQLIVMKLEVFYYLDSE